MGSPATYRAVLLLIVTCILRICAAQTCGSQAGGALCTNNLCCSQYGYCGASSAYCGLGCQSGPCTNLSAPQPPPPPSPPPSPPAPPPPPPAVVSPTPSCGVGKVITRKLFDQLYPNRNRTFYTYDAFIVAANSYTSFGTAGSRNDIRREIAALSAHFQQETAGLFYVEEIDQSFNYCDSTSTQYPCAPGQAYFGRGPLQLSWNFNYGAASSSVGANLLAQPYLVARDPVIAFKTALWFWTTRHGAQEPSCHEAIIGKWKPTDADKDAGRLPGFGVTTDIINGGIECGHKNATAQESNRVKYYKQYCAQLGVHPGDNLDCRCMKPF